MWPQGPRGERPSGLVGRQDQPTSSPIRDRGSALRTLGFDANTSPDRKQVKRAFRQAVLRSHPDLPGGDARRFLDVKAAYELLTGRAIATTVQVRPRGGPPDFVPGDPEYQDTGSLDPAEVEAVWREIGYNPYTGEALGPQDADLQEADAAEPSSWATAEEPRRPRRGRRREVRVTEVPRPRQDPRGGTDPEAYSAAAPVVLAVGLGVLALIGFARDAPEPSGELLAAGTSESPATARATPPPRAAALSQVRVAAATGLEYAVAVSAAEEGKVPVMTGGLATSPQVLRAWLAQPDLQGTFQALFPTRVGVGDPILVDDVLLERLWQSQGRGDRMRYLADGLLAALREPESAQTVDGAPPGGRARFGSVMVVAQQTSLPGLVNRLADEEGMELADMESAQPWRPGELPSALKSGRRTVRLINPTTGQEVVLIGASPLQQAFVAGVKAKDPLGRALPELWELFKRAPPDLVFLDLSSTALDDLCQDISPLFGIELQPGNDLLDPTTLRSFKPPLWAADLEP